MYNNRIYHFLISIPEEVNTDLLSGQWVGLDGIDRAMRMGVTSPQLSSEFFRLYTIALAWKTYHRNGRRKFPIKNYHPNFRIEDFFDYDVDYEDEHWLQVASLNQDKWFWPFLKFRLRSK